MLTEIFLRCAIEVCFRCMASMGRKRADRVYTDCSESAGWRVTEYMSLPWHVPPALAGLVGFCLGIISLDVMHLWHLGCCRDITASCMKLMCKTRGLYYDGHNIEARLAQMVQEIRAFAASQGKQVSFQKLTKMTLVWRTDKCPELHVSAADAGVCLAWLVEKLEEQPLPPPYDGALGCSWAAHNMVKMMMNSDFFLSSEEREAIYTVGTLYQVTYAKLAAIAHAEGVKLFKVRPKYHLISHLLSDVCFRASARNPAVDANWVDEDWVKWSLRMYRRMNRRTASLNLLKRTLITQKQRFLAKD